MLICGGGECSGKEHRGNFYSFFWVVVPQVHSITKSHQTKHLRSILCNCMNYQKISVILECCLIHFYLLLLFPFMFIVDTNADVPSTPSLPPSILLLPLLSSCYPTAVCVRVSCMYILWLIPSPSFIRFHPSPLLRQLSVCSMCPSSVSILFISLFCSLDFTHK